MEAVGRLGSYISKGVYTVSGPFHPFGGAVDIIVVKQRDGSFKSSPWYVRFGKFQGVLKATEKLVRIHVNGVEAEGLYMYLDHKGEAFFLKEVDSEESVASCSPPSSSGEDADGQPRISCPLKSKSCNYDSKATCSESYEFDKESIIRSNSRRAGYGLQSSRKDVSIVHANVNGVIRTNSLEHAEMAADLLDLKWSTNLLSSRRRKKDLPPRDTSKDEVKKSLQLDVRNIDEMDVICDSVKEMENGAGENGVVETSLTVKENEIVTEVEGHGLSLIHEEKVSVSEFVHGASENIVAESYSHSISVHPLNGSSTITESESVVSISSSGITPSVAAETKTVVATETVCEPQMLNTDVLDAFVKASIITEEERLLFGDLDDSCSNDAKHFCATKEAESSCSLGVLDETNEFANAKCCSSSPLDQSIINDYIDNVNVQNTRLRNVASDGCIEKLDQVQSKKLTRMRSLPSAEGRTNLEVSDLAHSSDSSCSDDKAGDASNHVDGNVLPSNSSLKGSQRSWPVPPKKLKGVKVSHHDMDGDSDPNPTETSPKKVDLEGVNVNTNENLNKNKKKVKQLAPTSEELASLNLKEGKNTVIFTFSTSMLGTQQVDARIFLWRWDTRIVISDVDGTITRSDLLGQVMPLVGMDWSQTGVAHLFSAIKENGYEFMFLSARSISQSFITRQFLSNIKQDGKALPEGPVVISPDGLFPSLFREVVRRAPHEFKIACLEDIKALFPADTNPFYAGFGNRDTDEFSYLKVGIPSGKIFIINPKGNIVVNRRVNKKSYSSLHTLVHGMFPSASSSEQEDFNSWNFWKLPPPPLDI